MKQIVLSFLMICIANAHSFSQCDCKINMSFERSAGGCFGQNCNCNCLPDNGQDSWEQCTTWGCGSTDIEPGGNLTIGNIQPSDGKSFMSMTCGPNGEGNSVKLCDGAPLKSGTQYCFTIDLLTKGGSTALALYGANSSCTTSQLLWKSPTISTATWTTQSFCFTPTADWTYISFRVVEGSGALGVDNWKSTDGKFPPQPDGTACAPTVSVRDTSVCANGCTQLTAIGKGGTPPYTFSWNDPANSQTASFSVCPGTATKSYTVTLKDAAGKTATAVGKVTVLASPVITVNAADICPSGNATLTASGASSYSWSPATGLSATTGASVVANPKTTTTYTVVGTNAAGCKDTVTTTVTVHPQPDVQATGGTICPNDSIQLKAINATTYVWTPASTLTQPTTATPTAHPATNTTYTVIGTDAFGCKDTATAQVDVVNNLVAVVSADTTICQGAGAQLFASGGSKFLWSPSTGLSNATIANPVASPMVTTTYEVTVSSGSCTGKKNVTVTVVPGPKLSATGGSICPGDSLQLNVSDANATSGITYSWSPAATLSDPSVANPFAQPASTTTYTVTGTSANGCVSTASATVTITNTIIPTINADTSLCIGASVQLKAGGGAKYAWTPATGLSNPAIANPVATPTVTTKYQVTVSSGSCVGTKDVTININPLPTITASAATICEKEKATLTASGANLYSWKEPSGAEYTGTSISLQPLVTTTYTVIGTDNKGCKDTITTMITVNPAPLIQVNSATICSGAEVTLTASGGNTYQWQAPGTTLPSASSVVVKPSVTTTYTVTGTGANGCKNTAVSTVMVNPVPDIAVNSGTICKGKSFTIKAVGAATSYAWSASDGSSVPPQAEVIVGPLSNTTYTVTGTAKGCSDTAIAHVNVNPVPVITVNNAAICARKEAMLTATGGSTYQWSTNAGGPTIVVAPAVTTSYTVTGTQGGCSGTATAVVTVYGNPIVSFYPNPRELSEDEPKVNLFNSTVGKNLLYEWTFGDAANPLNTSDKANPTHVYHGPGSYTICLKAIDSLHGCADSTCKDILYKPNWTLYVPNAFTPGDEENLNNVFYAYGTNILKFRMLIFDRWGNEIFESSDLYKGWDGKVKGKQELAQQDVYVWKIDCTDVFNKTHQYIGHVTLVR